MFCQILSQRHTVDHFKHDTVSLFGFRHVVGDGGGDIIRKSITGKLSFFFDDFQSAVIAIHFDNGVFPDFVDGAVPALTDIGEKMRIAPLLATAAPDFY